MDSSNPDEPHPINLDKNKLSSKFRKKEKLKLSNSFLDLESIFRTDSVVGTD